MMIVRCDIKECDEEVVAPLSGAGPTGWFTTVVSNDDPRYKRAADAYADVIGDMHPRAAELIGTLVDTFEIPRIHVTMYVCPKHLKQ
jgi:hypothetical protein